MKEYPAEYTLKEIVHLLHGKNKDNITFSDEEKITLSSASFVIEVGNELKATLDNCTCDKWRLYGISISLPNETGIDNTHKVIINRDSFLKFIERETGLKYRWWDCDRRNVDNTGCKDCPEFKGHKEIIDNLDIDNLYKDNPFWGYSFPESKKEKDAYVRKIAGKRADALLKSNENAIAIDLQNDLEVKEAIEHCRYKDGLKPSAKLFEKIMTERRKKRGIKGTIGRPQGKAK